MEIDFMGLNSTTEINQPNFKDTASSSSSYSSVADSLGGSVETSLSLSTTPSLGRGLTRFSEKKTKKKFSTGGTEQYSSRVWVQRPVFRLSTAPVLPYTLNHKSASASSCSVFRNMSQVIKGEPVSPNVTYSYSVCVPDKAESSSYTPPRRLSDHYARTGYTPTVAMARRATLARFLEKRSHRMNQAKSTVHLMGMPLNAATTSHDKTSVTDATSSSNMRSNTIFSRR